MSVINIGVGIFISGLGVGACIFLIIIANILNKEYKTIVGEYSIEEANSKIKDLQKSVDQIYEDYQDIGKMYFNLQDKVDIITAMCAKNYLNKETKELANEILKVLNVHAKAAPIKFGTDKNSERLIF